MIILDARSVKTYDALQRLGARSGKDKDYLEALWAELCADAELFAEFVYYLENHCFGDMVSCSGYRLTDLYFYLMRRYEVSHDTGKTLDDCDKEALVLDTFSEMLQMKKDPALFLNKLSKGNGMDLL